MNQDLDLKYQNGVLTSGRSLAVPALTVAGQVVTGGSGSSPDPTPPPNTPNPIDHGAIAWTAPPALCTTTTLLVSGTLYLARLPIRAAATVSKIWWANTAAASGATTGQCFAALYTSAGALLSSAAIDTKTTINVQSATLDTAQAISANSYVWAAMLWNATAPPTVLRGGGQSGPANSFNLAAASYQFATAGTGLTVLPSQITPANNSQTGAAALWMALS
ncbi:hypothetical protein ACGFZR_15135 [Streptomyces sp. NPDC048241]|uniref:hypothetical protein n=1 Tax=Streptomyces sp. NPDC048241 TaxID=3365521 RepID=UPI003723EC7A